jgi:hypothetical protein
MMQTVERKHLLIASGVLGATLVLLWARTTLYQSLHPPRYDKVVLENGAVMRPDRRPLPRQLSKFVKIPVNAYGPDTSIRDEPVVKGFEYQMIVVEGTAGFTAAWISESLEKHGLAVKKTEAGGGIVIEGVGKDGLTISAITGTRSTGFQEPTGEDLTFVLFTYKDESATGLAEKNQLVDSAASD